MRWNDIFWEEMVVRHSKCFDEDLGNRDTTAASTTKMAVNTELVVLPDIDDDDNLFDSLKKRGAVENYEALTTTNFSSINVENHTDLVVQTNQGLEYNSDNDILLNLEKIEGHPI
jgi:hypothetical protein